MNLPTHIIEDGNLYSVSKADNDRQVVLTPLTVTIDGQPGQSLIAFTATGSQPPTTRTVGMSVLFKHIEDDELSPTSQGDTLYSNTAKWVNREARSYKEREAYYQGVVWSGASLGIGYARQIATLLCLH